MVAGATGGPMIRAADEKLIDSMKEIIVQTTNPRRIVLFGSYAAGTATKDSDADFLVIEDDPFGPGRSRRKEAAKIWAALLPFEIAKDILVYSLDEVKRYENNPQHVVGQAIKTGRILYERQ